MKNLVFILGSNGYVGNALVKKFLSKDNFVIGIGRSKKSRQHKERNLKDLKDSNFQYFSLEDKNIMSLKPQLINYVTKLNKNSIFINSAWNGCQSISDGSLTQQFNNVYLSNDAIKLATQIGCDRFLYIGSIFENYIDNFINNFYILISRCI